jgi:hypothetical protein
MAEKEDEDSLPDIEEMDEEEIAELDSEEREELDNLPDD